MAETPFVNDQDQVNEAKKSKVPANYIPVKLSSMGKLSAPNIIHVRNYSGEEALKLSTMDETNSLQLLIDVIDNLIFEDFDAEMLNENEVEELMLNIYINWWNTRIEYPYEWTEEELEESDLTPERKENIRNGKDIPKVSINIADIKTTPIMKQFQEPIIIEYHGSKYYFRLSRVKDMIEAKNYVTEKYINEENQFSKIKKDIEYNNRIEDSITPVQERPIDQKLYRAYQEYLRQRALDFEKISQMSKVLKIDNKEIKTIDDKIKHYVDIPSNIWVKFNNIVDKSIQFGVNPKLNVKSPITNKTVTRRFQFQVLELIPTMELPDDSEYTVLFGEQ